MSTPSAPLLTPVPLSEVLDRLLAAGVALLGEATISVADVDLVYVALGGLLSSTATLRGRGRRGARPTPRAARGRRRT